MQEVNLRLPRDENLGGNLGVFILHVWLSHGERPDIEGYFPAEGAGY